MSKNGSRLRAAVFIATLIGAPHTAFAQTLDACRIVKSETTRLNCYDAIPLPDPREEKSSEPTANTREIVQSFAEGDYRTIDPLDLQVSPNKYKGKPVQILNAACLHSDKDEYRCVTPGAATVLIVAPEVTPAASNSFLETECGAVRNVATPKCRKTIRFVPALHESDLIDGYRQRVTIATFSIEIVPEAVQQRLQRRR